MTDLLYWLGWVFLATTAGIACLARMADHD